MTDRSDKMAGVMASDARRFAFGENWSNFVASIGQRQIDQAQGRLSEVLGNLNNKTFLDVGCGSGIHSLAAVRLGASRVFSFDYDEKSAACARELKQHFEPLSNWAIGRGSALDLEFLYSLGTFDIVYSWGVLHHTGDVWSAIANVTIPAADKLLISLYADQGLISKVWRVLKRSYVNHPLSRRPIELLSLATLWGPKLLIKPHCIIRDWRNYHEKRGMSPWHDIVDWAGGYPFEVTDPDTLIDFVSTLGFSLERKNLPRGVIRVNEYLFSKTQP